MEKRLRLKIAICGTLIVIAILAFIVYSIKHNERQKPTTVSQKPISVLMEPAKGTEWQEIFNAIGTIAAMKGIAVRAEVAGRITEIYMRSGTFVKKGTPLFQINPRILEAELTQRKASVSLSEFKYSQIKRLYAKGDISEEALEQAKSNLEVDKALVENINQQLILATVRAHFDGVIGLKKVDLGDYVDVGTVLAYLQDVKDMRVDFSIPERYQNQVKIGDEVMLSTGDSNKTYLGEIYAINSIIEQQSRTLSFRAHIKTDELKPGRYVNVKINIGKPFPVVTVPQTAVVTSLHGDYLYKVVDGKAKKVLVKPGERRGDIVSILEGIKPNDIVVSAGQFKLHDGALVTDKNVLMVKPK